MAGLWAGNFISSDGHSHSVIASLSFLPHSSSYPSVFGAILADDHNDNDNEVAIVHGGWNRDSGVLNMKEIRKNGVSNLLI